MKYTMLIIAALVVGVTFAGCPTRPPEEISAVTIAVNGLTCDMCVSKVEMAVKTLEGVHEVTVDLKEKLASVRFEQAKVNLGEIEHAIAEAGYAANGTLRNEKVHEELPSCCQ